MGTVTCKWRNGGGGAWHTTLDSDVSGIYIKLDASDVQAPFAVMVVKPMPQENEKVGAYADLTAAKKAAKAYYIEHLGTKE